MKDKFGIFNSPIKISDDDTKTTNYGQLSNNEVILFLSFIVIDLLLMVIHDRIPTNLIYVIEIIEVIVVITEITIIGIIYNNFIKRRKENS